MRSVRALLIYLLVVFVGGALLAPWLYRLVQSGAAHSAALDHLAHNPFPRYVNRCLLGLALIGLWPLLRGLQMNSWREVGFSGERTPVKKIALGFMIGFGSLAVVAGLAIVSGTRQLHFEDNFAKNILGAVITAIIVPILEELLFRGALFGSLRKTLRWTTALVISSAIYALVHFLKKGNALAQIDWFSGLAVLGQMFRNFADFDYVVPAFFVLFMAGAILALAYQRTGSLYMSIGIHAGWIFWLKSYMTLTHGVTKEHSTFWGGDGLVDGWVAFLILGGILLVLAKFLPQTKKMP